MMPERHKVLVDKSKEASDSLKNWYRDQGWKIFPFQKSCFDAISEGKSGLLQAPTGSGKTLALGLPLMLHAPEQKGLSILWITPLRALTEEIKMALERAARSLRPDFSVGSRNGDTKSSERSKQRSSLPNILITTPESLHLLMSSKTSAAQLRHVGAIVVDEWHELMGSKRGVLLELALSRLRCINPLLMVWGISATIGNLEEAMEVLFPGCRAKACLIGGAPEKKMVFRTLIPDTIEKFPWAGHLGLRMLPKLKPFIDSAQSILLFTNTRAQTEIWYRELLEAMPELAGTIAMHHGSLSRETRNWVEQALHEGTIKLVVCTSSLDLGVDFRPVDLVIQIGSPKGVSRFVQRAGRSGHGPGETSEICFVPTHALELLESWALQKAAQSGTFETRIPMVRCFDVLIQYCMTLACGEGFRFEEAYQEITQTHAFSSVSPKEWQQCLDFLVSGGESLKAYDDFVRLEKSEDGLYFVSNKRTAMRHRMSIGVIVSDTNLQVRFANGKHIGSIEEWFLSQLKEGDAFVLGGKTLELKRIEGMRAIVGLSKGKNIRIPSWLGGRMSLSSEAGQWLRKAMEAAFDEEQWTHYDTLQAIRPLLELQKERSAIPGADQLLIEYIKSDEGYHLFVYPFEGRLIHEGLGLLLAYRLAQIKPFTFSIAMNDYGFELLSDEPIPIEEGLEEDLFRSEGLSTDIERSVNLSEMAKRKFRDIASISGLTFRGYPGRIQKERQLQASSALFFNVFSEYEPENLLRLQAYEEARYLQLEQGRLITVLNKLQQSEVILKYLAKAGPFAFPLMAERLNRDTFSNEKVEDKLRRMIAGLEP